MNDRRIDDALRRAAREQRDQPDSKRLIIESDNGEIEIQRQNRNIEFRDENGIQIPYTVETTTYRIGLDGKPYGKMYDIGECAKGHKINSNSLFRCRYCRKNICSLHGLRSGRRVYCRTGFCLVIGLVDKFFSFWYRVISFSLCSILGLGQTEENSKPERDFFSKEG